MNKESKFDIGALIEKYRFLIGGSLLFVILLGSGLMLWQENYRKQSLEERIKNLESKISQLETRNNNQSNLNNQISNIQTDQGQVAGTSSQNSDNIQQKDNGGILKQVQDDNKITGKININTASATQLDSLSGIGPTYAQRIIEYRNTNGGFKSIDELKKVKGIGEKTFEKFKDNITI